MAQENVGSAPEFFIINDKMISISHVIYVEADLMLKNYRGGSLVVEKTTRVYFDTTTMDGDNLETPFFIELTSEEAEAFKYIVAMSSVDAMQLYSAFKGMNPQGTKE